MVAPEKAPLTSPSYSGFHLHDHKENPCDDDAMCFCHISIASSRLLDKAITHTIEIHSNSLPAQHGTLPFITGLMISKAKVQHLL